jgi:hypothetical protein
MYPTAEEFTDKKFMQRWWAMDDEWKEVIELQEGTEEIDLYDVYAQLNSIRG